MILLSGSPKEWTLGLLPLLASTIGLAQAAESYEELQKASNASLLWGPYRPNLYFGVRPRIPKSLLMGVMWSRVEDYTNVQNGEPTNAPSVAQLARLKDEQQPLTCFSCCRLPPHMRTERRISRLRLGRV